LLKSLRHGHHAGDRRIRSRLGHEAPPQQYHRKRRLPPVAGLPARAFPTSERRLEDMKCGELRWSDREQGWEVLILSVAVKNSGSSFFGQKPFRLILPNLLDLYKYLEAYIINIAACYLVASSIPARCSRKR